jgi:hypothetical protein
MRVDDLAAKGLGRQSRNQISEYLSQRRKGRKGKNCHFDRREKSFLDPSYPLGMTGTARHLASWRLGEMNIRIRDFSLPKVCAWRANFEL